MPELTEGPYYVNENLDRSDIRIDTSDGSVSEGAVLTLDWVVSQVDGNACIPLEGVLVDVWHCDAEGNYSDVGERAGPRLPARLPAHGRVGQGPDRDRLSRLVPGPRGPHPLQDPDRCRGGERLRVHVAALLRRRVQRRGLRAGVYAAKGTPGRPERHDGIYQQSQGMTLLDVVKDGDGYKATFEIAIQTT